MCGIYGLYETNPTFDKKKSLKNMSSCMTYRGPDDQNIWHNSHVGLGHNRLSIIDLSSAGKQPMKDSVSGRYIITYNGELYNYKDLRAQLEKLGYIFHSSSDTEVVVNSWHQWHQGCLNKFNGMFAFAVWDNHEKKLFIARDHIGMKPLFYIQKSPFFAFSSEIKALLSLPQCTSNLDEPALDSYFTFNYTPAPHTGLQDIKQLLPGHYLEFKEYAINIHRYWQPDAITKSYTCIEEASEEFEEIWTKTLHRHCVADVPICAFLSGGLDSSAICVGLGQQNITAKTIRFDQHQFDESNTAQKIATHLGMPHTIIDADFSDASLLYKVAKHLQEPCADSSALAVYTLCQNVSKTHKVALSGDGADEFLAGYETYIATRLARKFKRPIMSSMLGPLQYLSYCLPHSSAKYSFKEKLERFSLGASLPFLYDHASWRQIISKKLKNHIYTKHFQENAKSLFDTLTPYVDTSTIYGENLSDLTKILSMDQQFYLPNDMLVKVDRMSMAHSLEVRLPFLDKEIISFCLSLPDNFKIHKNQTKQLLRHYLSQKIPKSIVNLPKSGFNIPVSHYFRTLWKDVFLNIVEAAPDKAWHLLDKQSCITLLKRNESTDLGHPLFGITIFLLWLKNMEN